MNSTRRCGNSAVSRSASARPPMSGITTSVSSRSTPPGCASHRLRRRRRASGADEHLVAAAAEHDPHELAHALVVLDDHDRLAAALGGGLRRPSAGPHRPRGDRQVDLERGPAALLAVDEDRAAALLDDAEHGRQPEARPAAAGLGGEERLEQAPADLVAHADAGVADRQQHVRARRDVAVGGDVGLLELDVGGLDRQPAAAGHRVARVGGEVEHDPLDLGAVGLDRRDAARRAGSRPARRRR